LRVDIHRSCDFEGSFVVERLAVSTVEDRNPGTYCS
jgi:hypothetical protein